MCKLLLLNQGDMDILEFLTAVFQFHVAVTVFPHHSQGCKINGMRHSFPASTTTVYQVWCGQH